jgi:hypothetical protein
MRYQQESDYAIRDILRDARDVSRSIADGDESVYTFPEELINVDNPILNQGSFALENFGFHETRLDFNGLSECEECGDITASCSCN